MSNTLTSEMATKIIEKELGKGGIFHPDSIKTKEEKILALKEIIHRLDVGNSNGITVLYSGIIGTDTSGKVIQSEELIKNIKAKNGFRVLDNTPAFDFLDFDGGKKQPRNESLKKALISIFGYTGFDRGTPANNFLFGEWKNSIRSPGAFDIISNNFAAGAKGSVIAIVPNANPKKVFGATELKALLNNPDVTAINGIDKQSLVSLAKNVPPDASDLAKILAKVKAISKMQMVASGILEGVDDISLNKYLSHASTDFMEFLKHNPEATNRITKYLSDLREKDLDAWKGLKKEFNEATRLGTKYIPDPKTPGKYTKHLGKLGIIGLGIGLFFAAQEAKAADAAGDHERAKDIMAEWAVGEAGSSVAGAAGTSLTVLAGTLLLGLSAPVAAVAGVAVGIVAGIYGEDMAKELYQLTKDLDNNGRRDIWDRLITAAVGQDFKPNEIPEMLKNKAVSLKPEMPLEELIAKAKSDIAYRYALRELNPFVAEGADYTSFNTDGTLDLWTPDNPNGMTEDYIRDRAYMVLLQMRYLKNGLKLARDLVDDLVQGDWDYMDHSRHPFRGDINRPLTFSVDGKGISVDDHRVVFGSNLSDDKEYDKVNLEGGGRDDRIYGLNGHDRLAGKGGSDHLEGGKGHDIYQFSTKDDGIDTIFDSDGDGSLEIDEENIGEQTFSGIAAPESSRAGDVYYSDDKKYRMENMQNYWQFSVKDSTGNYKALAKLKPRTGDGKWSNGDLGITLKYNPDPNAGLDPSAFNPYDAGKPVYYYYNAALSPERVRIHGSDSHSSQFTATSFDDVIYTGNGELHHVMGAGGNDYIVGGNGREIIYAGTGNRGVVQNDDDTAFGGGNSDIITGGDGNDTLYADDGSNSYENPLPNESALTESEKRGDWISGQHGSDTIIGSAKKDVLAGGAGDDAIRAGAGDDLVLGDANYVPSSMFNNLSYSQQTFEKRWFADGTTRNFYDAAITVPSHIAFEWTWSHDDKDFSVKPGKGARMMATDRVQGTGNDTLYGGAGNDWMAGQAGNDEMHGDNGDDTMYGDDAVAMPERFASGDDQLYAGKGKDKLHGGAGNDVLDASDDDNDKDELSGDEGDDQLKGGTGGDKLNGGAGNDALYAGKDKTLMDGGSGNDIFFGNSGDDTMTDEEGDDHYHISAGTDSIKDSAGYDGYHIMFSRLMPPGVTTIHDSDGKGFITYQGRKITHDSVRAVAENEWVTDTGAKLARDGSNLVITNGPKGSQGKVVFTGFFNSEEFLGLKLPSLDDDNKPSPEPKPDPKPQPPSPVRPVPDQPKAPTAGKPLAAQSIHEKDKLTYTLAEDTFHTANKDDKLSYSARLADGKPLPKWLNFDAATRTFSGTPGNDDVGTLDIEISVQGKGGSASQHLALNVINVNDAPQAGQKLPVQQVKHSRLFYYQLPENAFKDIDKDDKLTFSATGENGQPLPGWLKFDTYNARFIGSPSANTPRGNYRVTVTATDSGGLKAHQTLELNLVQGMPLKPVNGTDRNDVLTSTADNELLAGRGGKDVYQFARGFGHDLINNHDENSNQDDVVVFTNMNRKDFMIMRDNTDLYLRSISGADELWIMGQFLSNTKWRIGEIRFADGSVLTADEIERELRKTTEGDDYIYGSKGNDIINGKGGNDVISGEEGDDELYGEDGNDDLVGSAGNDKLFGGAGDDSLNGGDGGDHLSGGAGNDELVGGEGDDQLHGNEGDDKLYGGTGNDLLIGGSGNDVLSGSAGNDIYRFARGFGRDVINNYDAGLGRHDSIDFSDINRSDVDIRREGGNLVLRSKDGKDQITVTNHFFNGWQIDSIRFADGTTLDHDAINSLANTRNAPRGNYMEPAAQALQMNQAIASLNGQAQPLDALATPDLQPRPLLAAGHP